MTETERTTPAPESATTSAELVEDPHGYEGDHAYSQHVQLGLRPIYYAESESHPDTRPCPAWCGLDPDEHDVWPECPLEAIHTSSGVRTVASRYQGFARDEGTLAPHHESYLHQRGQEPPVIKVRRLSRSTSRAMKIWNVAELSLDDAQELVTVLQYLIAQADAAEVLSNQI